MTIWKQLLAWCCAVALLVSGCGSSFGPIRKGLELGARGIVAADRSYAPVYLQLAKEALAKAAAIVDYNILMEDPNAVVYSLEAAKVSLLATEAALDVWESTNNPKEFLAASKELIQHLSNLRDGLETFGVDVPEELDLALQTLGKVL